MTDQELKECREAFEEWQERVRADAEGSGAAFGGGTGLSRITSGSTWDAWQAAWNRRAVPEGMKLVPVEPESEMMLAGTNAMDYWSSVAPPEMNRIAKAAACYRAMLNAAPKP